MENRDKVALISNVFIISVIVSWCWHFIAPNDANAVLAAPIFVLFVSWAFVAVGWL